MPAMDALSKVASRDGTYITGCQRRTRNMYEAIQYSVDDPIATITFNRPDRLNALTGQMLAELQQELRYHHRRIEGLHHKKSRHYPGKSCRPHRVRRAW